MGNKLPNPDLRVHRADSDPHALPSQFVGGVSDFSPQRMLMERAVDIRGRPWASMDVHVHDRGHACLWVMLMDMPVDAHGQSMDNPWGSSDVHGRPQGCPRMPMNAHGCADGRPWASQRECQILFITPFTVERW